MDKTIMLRPHHFGEIYEIFAGWLSTKSSEKYIDSLIKRKIDFFVSSTNYPQETINKLKDILLNFFSNDDILVVFKKGPDSICNSGCLLFNKESIASADSECVKIAKMMTIAELCEKENPKEDVLMEEIFEIEIGKKYRKEELKSKMIHVFQKYRKIYWKRLISEN
ncbi:MAG: hypothetical protein UT90_C0003G0013 [Parcubacteria group bacterium GW2011_GWA1_40_21]|nr:MAG: hypothetical protein UT80_C0031G0007 [Parcubacteria group bacterium GW2011_GWC1_40_13]KKR53965.1 MAG: hypothetical protein UT90_C0003G0013 [Parcubacteria group bacterium GW2011_GWA1_40_21]